MLSRFIISFSKTYIPLLILLIVFTASRQYIPNLLSPQNNTSSSLSSEPKSSNKLSKAHTASKNNSSVISTSVTEAKPPLSAETAVPPTYYYLIEFESGGSMEAKYVRVKDATVEIGIDNGYEMTLAKNSVKSIKKHKVK